MYVTHTHTHTHTHTTLQVWPSARQGAAAVCERCELPVQDPHCDLRSDQGRPCYGWRRVAISDGGRAIWRAKKEGRNSYGGFGISSTVSRPRRQAREMVERCCSCTRHSTCYIMGLSARACECRNAARQCTGCHCWDKCRNKGRFMPSPTTTRGLLGHFPRGADPPAIDRRATTPPVQSLTSSSLRAILAAGAGGRSAWGTKPVLLTRAS